MNINNLTKTTELRGVEAGHLIPLNLNWWEDPYTFACLELKSMLCVKKHLIENINLKDIFPNAEVITYKCSNNHRYYFFAKIDDYMIITYIDDILHICYNSKFKSEESINNLIDKFESMK